MAWLPAPFAMLVCAGWRENPEEKKKLESAPSAIEEQPAETTEKTGETEEGDEGGNAKSAKSQKGPVLLDQPEVLPWRQGRREKHGNRLAYDHKGDTLLTSRKVPDMLLGTSKDDAPDEVMTLREMNVDIMVEDWSVEEHFHQVHHGAVQMEDEPSENSHGHVRHEAASPADEYKARIQASMNKIQARADARHEGIERDVRGWGQGPQAAGLAAAGKEKPALRFWPQFGLTEKPADQPDPREDFSDGHWRISIHSGYFENGLDQELAKNPPGQLGRTAVDTTAAQTKAILNALEQIKGDKNPALE